MEYLDEQILKKRESEIGIARSKVNEDLTIIRNWVNQQPHLPNLENDSETNEWIYKFLFHSKNRIEMAKQHLEDYFSCKSLMPEFFDNRDPEDSGIKSNVQALYLITFPKLTPEGYRIHFFCHAVPEPTAYQPKDFMRRALMMCDWKVKNDLTAGDVIIMHMKYSSLAHWKQYNFVMLSKFIAAVTVHKNLILSLL
ncbi:hypothetical protein RUM44_008023 [Polyplax serrata]|uniref:CRAL-TRIO domain-containing protein n=1 Tax=Polyplax serrata TaxID=468196 RepID=A0ABR1BB60_POLSC